MKSYSAIHVFSKRERTLLHKATTIVGRLPGQNLRCHEVARVVGQILELEVVDGHFGLVEHSWCLTGERWRSQCLKPHVLDVYAVGRLPQVQLVDFTAGVTPRMFRPCERRDDIDEALVAELVLCATPIGDLIDRSSLGTPEAKAIRALADPETVRRVVERTRPKKGPIQ